MNDNLNDVIPDGIQDKNNTLNEILNSVDSRLKPNKNIPDWEDEINSVLEKRSRKSEIEDILNELESKKEKTITHEVSEPKKSQDDVLELVEQITIGKKVSEMTSQKKVVAEEVREIPKKEETVKEKTQEKVTAESTIIIPLENYDYNIIKNNKSDSKIKNFQGENKSDTLVYNTLQKKAPPNVVRSVIANTPTAQVRKPVKKIVRVENTPPQDSNESHKNVKKNVPKQSTASVRPEKNMPKKKSKKSLKEKFIDLFPQKQDSVPEKIRKVVFLCSICAIIVCGYMVGDYYIDLGKSKNLHQEIASIYEPYPFERSENVATIYEPDTERTYTVLDGARKLLDMNPDVVGYITIPNTPISNPVMQSGDNEKYLDKNINGEQSRAGELFLDYRNNFDRVVNGKLSVANSDNLVIYGHNMKNDEMFGSLKYYQRNYSYYNEHPVIYLNSNYECYTYKIFSYFILDAFDDSETAYDCWNKFDFDGEEDFYNFVNEAKKRSFGLNDVDVKYGDKILTLSTCNTVLGDRGRLIVMGRLLRDGEDVKSGTEKNVQNANVKWPSIYYQEKPNERYNPDAEFVPYG
ncbi:MAG: class B sortase [Ruminococcus sp.]|nr:class B sortase [Ruminococcus sp.]